MGFGLDEAEEHPTKEAPIATTLPTTKKQQNRTFKQIQGAHWYTIYAGLV